MTSNKKQQMSLFLITMSTGSVAMASTCNVGSYDPLNGSNCQLAPAGSYVATAGASAATLAEPGRYAPTTGMTAALLAPAGSYTPNAGMTATLPSPAGYYIPNSGSSAATPAPIGQYAPNTGMTAALPAPAGYYVPTTGASAATAVSPGFYAPTTGMGNQLPTGGLAAPITSAIQSSQALQQLSNDLINTNQDKSLKVAIAHQRNTVKQEALTQSQFKTNISSIVLQADLAKNGDQSYGLQAGFAHHKLNNQDVTNDGNSYQLGFFNTGSLGNLKYQVTGLVGKSSSDNLRQASILKSSGTTQESLNANSDTSWYGITSRFNYPIIKNVNMVADIGALSYKSDAIRESGSASLNGSSTTSVASLSTDALHYTAIPAMLGVSYNLIAASNTQRQTPVVLTVGIIGDLNSKQNLGINSGGTRIYNLPIQQSSNQGGVIKISFNQWELSKDTQVSGTAQTQVGSKTTLYQAGLNIVKKW